MKRKWIYLILPVLALVLEILPYGAVCVFALDGGDSLRQAYSYFSLVPFGYANFAPLLTAIATCIVLLLLCIYMWKGGRSMERAVGAVVGVGMVLSLCPLLYGVQFFSVIGALISAALVAEWVLCKLTLKTENKEE